MRLACPLLFLSILFHAAGAEAPTAQQDASRTKEEAAVRARAKRYYALLAADDFRAAEKLVCPGLRGEFNRMAKPAFRTATIGVVVLTDALDAATVVSHLEPDQPVPATAPASQLSLTHWRRAKPGWCMEPDIRLKNDFRAQVAPGMQIIQSPMGPMPVGTVASPLPQLAPTSAQAIAALSSGVTLSKNTLRFSRHTLTRDTIGIHNGLNGDVRLELDCPLLKSFTCALDRSALTPGADAVLTVTFDPAQAHPNDYPVQSMYVILQPFLKRAEIAILFD